MHTFTIRYTECRTCGIVDDAEIMDDDQCIECHDLDILAEDLRLALDEEDSALHYAVSLDDDDEEKRIAEEEYLQFAADVAELKLQIAHVEKLRDQIRANVNG